ISLLADMNALSEKIKSYVGNTDTGAATSTSAVAAPVPTSEPVSTTNQASAGKTNTLYQRIADGVATGKINRSEANTLFDMESRIHGLETQLRSTTTGDFERQRLMFRELEQLTGSIDQNLAGR
ncbi:MAG: hypothetical protein K8F91_02535, partial [Candidatus Obscuribacterales bacterium]|nr:hypothetical protein [Candidatus Obscuribacterales bacterium]